jgi:hypothetical protein
MIIGKHLRTHNNIAQRQMWTKEYTWVGVNDMQGLLRKSRKDLKQTRKAFLYTVLEKQ